MMRYEKKLDFILKSLAKNGGFMATYDIASEVKAHIGGHYLTMLNDLAERRLIMTEMIFTDRHVAGFRITEKGKDFISRGGYGKQIRNSRINSIFKVGGGIIIVWTFIITLKQCIREESKGSINTQASPTISR